MANVSKWKDTEKKAALLFPGGRRRTRIGGPYDLVADDVIWGPEEKRGKKVFKQSLPNAFNYTIPPLFIECKKRAAIATVSEFKKAEKKYRKLYEGDGNAELVAIFQVKYDKRQFVMVSDDFFEDLLSCWIDRNQIVTDE